MRFNPEDYSPLIKRSDKLLEKRVLDNIFVTVAQGEYQSFPMSWDFAELVYSSKKPEDIGTDALTKIKEIRQVFDETGNTEYYTIHKRITDELLDHAEQDVQRGLYRDALTGVLGAERYFMHSREWTNPKAGARIRPVPGTRPGDA